MTDNFEGRSSSPMEPRLADLALEAVANRGLKSSSSPAAQCWHKEINDDGYCKACGVKAAIKLPFAPEEFRAGLSASEPESVDMSRISHQTEKAQAENVAKGAPLPAPSRDQIIEEIRNDPRTMLFGRSVAEIQRLICEDESRKSPLPASSIGFVNDQLHEGPSCTLCGATMQFKCLSCGSTPACTEPLPAPSPLTDWRGLSLGMWFLLDDPNCTNRYSVQERTGGGCAIVCLTPYHHDQAKRSLQEIVESHNWLARAEVGDSGAQKEK